MIQTLLIANRGEIARRVMRTAQRMGIRCVAVYSDADANAPHVREADEAVHLGPAPATESYLLADKVIAAAKQTGADAIHPGYGFLSENADFADACAENGITFVGPSAHAIRAMGLKDQAKVLMEKADVPVTPGYHGADQDADILKAAADAIGYPVLIKAVAGGGGKGMRKVDEAGAFMDSLESCQREASKSFGDDRVLIEKFITNPRHIEVQVFGDSHGRVIHMYERDCSLQRRHQKVIEEAPAPGMTPEVRAAMCSAAVNAARAVDYVGAGTVEFIVDGSGPLREDGFYFMEMNTRLQVEHPVTELVTDWDLVELQLKVAAGGSVPPQDQVRLAGHAMEARLYAEDPVQGFLPSTGPLDRLTLPEDGDGIRVDTGVEEGGEVSLYYDPMIAKVIAFGDNRRDAAFKLAEALDEVAVYPVRTNAAFLRRAALDEDFLAERLDTGFIEAHMDRLIPPAINPVLAGFAAIAAQDGRPFLQLDDDPFAAGDGWRLNQAARIRQRFTIADEEITVDLHAGDGDAEIRLGETACQLSSIAPNLVEETGWIAASIDGEEWLADVERMPDGILVSCRGETAFFAHPHPEMAAESAEAGGSIKAPMPGKVLALNIASGDSVTKGQALVVLEAMKMEHSLPAPRDGVIGEVSVAMGDQVAEGDVLVAMQEEAPET